MHPAQARYAVAKAALDAVHATADEQMGPFPEKASEEERRAYIDAEVKLEEELGYYPAFNEWCDARLALVQWGKSVALRLCRPEQRAELAEMYDHIQEHPVEYDKLIDLTFRLRA